MTIKVFITNKEGLKTQAVTLMRCLGDELFREQQVVNEKLPYLRRAYVTNSPKESRRCCTDKIHLSYRESFLKLIQEDNLSQAMEEYPEGCAIVDEQAKKENGKVRKFTPEDLMEIAEKCTNYEELEDTSDTKIEITKNGNLSNKAFKDLIKKYKQDILKENEIINRKRNIDDIEL